MEKSKIQKSSRFRYRETRKFLKINVSKANSKLTLLAKFRTGYSPFVCLDLVIKLFFLRNSFWDRVTPTISELHGPKKKNLEAMRQSILESVLILASFVLLF